MTCQNCGVELPDKQIFCGDCGYKQTPETIASLHQRLANVEFQLEQASTKKGVEQHTLELETSESVVKRITDWSKLFLYWVAIPYGAILLGFGLYIGKGELKIQGLISEAQKSFEAAIVHARSESNETEKIVQKALTDSKNLRAEIQTTQGQVENLKHQTELRLDEVQRLSLALTSEQKQAQRLQEQIKEYETGKISSDIRKNYPVFGKRVVESLYEGYIIAQEKPAGTKYLSLNLALNPTPIVDEAKVSNAIAVLKEHKYRTILNALYTYTQTESSRQAIGMGLDANSCMYWVAPPSHVPCLIYFDESLKASAMEVREILKPVQEIPDDHIKYVNPHDLDPQRQELIRLSGIDIAVIIGEKF